MSPPVWNDDEMMSLAARLALRGRGAVEPNPIVGCVIAHPDGRVAGVGHHRVFGGPHAEVEAIENARARGVETRGASAWVTLEPCAHTGKTPPCTNALLSAGIARLVIARRDPHAIAAGGVEILRDAGLEVLVRDARDLAWWTSEPFAYRLRTGLPWVIAKWAQTLDGAIATRTGESKWISGSSSRRRVHAERGRVDAILTGIGTVLADDPALTARDVPSRRTPVRAVIDPELQIPPDSQLVRAACEIPLRVYTSRSHETPRSERLRDAGVEVITLTDGPRGLSVEGALRDLATRAGVSTVMIESGPGLLGRAVEENVVNEALVFVAPMLLGDERARHAVSGLVRERLSEATTMTTWRVRRVGDDTMLRFVLNSQR